MSDFNLSIIISVFTAGLLSFFSPCIIPLLPVYVGYFSSDDGLISENQKVLNKILKTLFFIAGISVVFFILGFGAGALGDFLSGTTFSIICGIIILFFGLNQAGLIKIPILDRQFNLNWKINSKGFFSVFI